MNVELTIRSKTLLTTFFVIDGKGSYSLLLGHDWIHANGCVPSTVHQCLIQWHGDDVELVHADDSMSIAIADPMYWELEDFECFSSKLWEGGFIKISNEDQQSIQAIGSESLFQWIIQWMAQVVNQDMASRRSVDERRQTLVLEIGLG